MREIHHNVATFIHQSLVAKFDYPARRLHCPNGTQDCTVFDYDSVGGPVARPYINCYIELNTKVAILHTLTLVVQGEVVDTFALPLGAVYHIEADILLWLNEAVAYLKSSFTSKAL